MTRIDERTTIAPATAWKIKTGNAKLTAEFIGWITEKKRRFIALMERVCPGFSKRPLTQDELDIFCDWVCETEGVAYKNDQL